MLADVPSGVSPLQAAVATDAVATAYHAVHRRAEVKSHETVLLFGLGGLGFNGLQVLKTTGARIIVSEIRQERLDAAVKLGVPESDIVPIGTSVQEFVKQNGLEEKIDTTIDFVGLKQTFEDAQQVGKNDCTDLRSLRIDLWNSPASRKDGLHWNTVSRKHDQHESGCTQTLEHPVLVWCSSRRPRGSASIDSARCDTTRR